MPQLANKVVITCAVTGSIHTPTMSEALPITPDQIATQAIDAAEAGAAILHLPDFYGPRVHVGTLQNALNEAASGKTVNWIGNVDVHREYVYVPDAMRIAAALGARAEAFGAHWCLPGGGPLSARQAAEIASRRLGRAVKVRSAGLTTLRIVSLFNKDLRGLLQIAPDYMKPVRYDVRKLQDLLGPSQMTSYDTGIGQTFAWIVSGR
jgi:nucleoside-diphosphate-sugar epimerase